MPTCLLKYCLVAAALTLGGGASAQSAVPQDPFVASLRGVGELAVLVTEPSPDVQATGLTAPGIAADVRALLTAAGVRVINAAEGIPNGTPYLNVELMTFTEPGAGGPVTAYAIHLRFRQRTCLERAPEVCLHAVTWNSQRAGIVRSARTDDYRQLVREAVQSFLGRLREANAE